MEATEIPIACTLSEAAFQERRAELLKTVMAAVVNRQEVDGGFAYGFPSDPKWIAQLAQVIAFERECCHFLQFALRVERGKGPIWLELTGPEGTKTFLAEVFG